MTKRYNNYIVKFESEYYPSLRYASEAAGINRSTLSKAIIKKSKVTGLKEFVVEVQDKKFYVKIL